MYLLLELIIIVCYMINGYFGFAAMSLISMIILMNKKENIFNKIIKLLIMSLPMSYIGILGMQMHQFISWYNIFLLIFLFCCMNKNNSVKLSKENFFVVFICLILLLLGNITETDLQKSMIEILQVFMMIFPIAYVFNKNNKFPLTKKDIKKLLQLYLNICLATAIAMIIQYLIYYNTHKIIGIIAFTGGGRVSCFCLFKGASILPIFMGIGFLITLIDMLNKKMALKDLIKTLIIFIAMVLNTSRSALAILFIVSGLIIFNKIRKKINIKTIIITFIVFAAAIIGTNYILKLRSNLNGFLDANGRYETWMNGIYIWTNSIKNFLLGAGFRSDLWITTAKPHNVIFQSLAQCGIVFTTIIFAEIFKYFIINKKNPYIYIILFIIMSGMLVTDFYANAFTTIIFILVELYRQNRERINENE